MTPRVQGEPIVPGSDFGLFASEEAKDFIFWFASSFYRHWGVIDVVFNKGIEIQLCVNSSFQVL